MIAFIVANLGTILISALLLAIVIWILAVMIKKKKKGKSIGCDCGCSSCPAASACHKPENTERP